MFKNIHVVYGGIFSTKGRLRRRTTLLLPPLFPITTVPDDKTSSWLCTTSLSPDPFNTSHPLNVQGALPILVDSKFSPFDWFDELLVAASAAAARSKRLQVWSRRFLLFVSIFSYRDQTNIQLNPITGNFKENKGLEALL